MNHNRKVVLGILFFALIVLSFWYYKRPVTLYHQEPVPTLSLPTNVPPSAPRTLEDIERLKQEKRKKVITQVQGMYDTPIKFFGKVVDQNGNPVPDAQVGYSMADTFMASGSSSHKSADSKGYFEISGVKGATLGIKVTKDGYYEIPNISYQYFAYGVGADQYFKVPPTPELPAIFTLHKAGETEPLISLSSRQFEIPLNGHLASIDLETGKKGHPGMEVSCRVSPKGQGGRFDWSYEMTVKGGGFVERKGQFEFMAPEEGYQQTVKVHMPASDSNWKINADRSYFVKLPGEKYALIEVTFRASDYRSIIVLKSHSNHEPSHRNLEFDPWGKTN